jgi:hypothetical protein
MQKTRKTTGDHPPVTRKNQEMPGTHQETRGQREYRQKLEREEREARAAKRQAVVDLYVADLGGTEALSAATRALIDVIATTTVQLHELDEKFNAGDVSAEDLSLYNRLSGNLRRLLSSLPKRQRGARPPSLAEVRARYVEG